MDEPVDVAWLVGRVLRPGRSSGAPLADDPRRRFRATELVACRTCRGSGAVGGYTGDDPPEWEEEAWTCTDCGTYGRVPADTPLLDRPPVPGPFEADPDGVRQAEEATRTAVRRLAPWGVPAVDRVVWRVGGPLLRPVKATLPHPRAEVLRRLLFREWSDELGRIPHHYVPLDGLTSLFATRAAWHARLDRAWRRAADRALTVPASVDRPDATGRSMADLPNPFAPLIGIWAAGYAFADATDDAIHLVAPEPA
ncbi:hypothetical protein [Actinomadura rayongensis]|uniref:Uncharacterized protein n=1 Tax=Actinomadura rayongensis TaxID=1429076 RepID=A0A6I4WDS5_9ACTN|nr:hypothetical protein [Actinomadura rayongensis]MXQ67898.1 hypothetical protein [Actinomadura rayongensis]